MRPESDGIGQMWAELLVEELVRHGVTTFFASPGSRSTPLVVAAGRNARATVHMHFDERGSAFMALGHARMTGRAAAWLTTSGTALANGHPAAVEARLERLPMILLTADRPPELRDTSANQTIRQVGMFGEDVVWSFDMPVPTRAIAPSFVLTTVAEAVRRSADGPVHLNCMFREPLFDGDAERLPPHEPDALAAWRAGSSPWTTLALPDAAAGLGAVRTHMKALFAASRRPLLLLGRMPVYGRAVLPTESQKGDRAPAAWPVLADIASQYRTLDLGAVGTPVIHYDAILHDRDRWSALAPDMVVQLGRPPVSKRWQQFLEATRPGAVVVVDDAAQRIDPGHLVTHRFTASPHALLAALAEEAPAFRVPADMSWAARWAALERAARERIAGLLDGDTSSSHAPLTEQGCVRTVIDAMGETRQPLVLGNSLPIRHADTFTRPMPARQAVVVNRGASGIDGQVSTAIGAAQATGARAVLLLGDLTLLHDLNALAAARHVTIVVLNNDGGGIFSWLPVAAAEDVFTPLFATPHGFSFRAAADMFGLSYEAPESLSGVTEAVRRGMAADGGVLVEVRAQRAATIDEQKDLLASVTRGLRAAVPLS